MASFSFISYLSRLRGKVEGRGEGIKEMEELEFQKCKGLKRLVQCFLTAMM